VTDLWEAQREALGAFIRDQRKRANLSLRQLAEMTSLSNPYLSQVERGLHQPSVRVLKAISDALNLSAETLMAQAGLIDAIATTADGTAEARAETKGVPDTEDAIRADQRLSDEQKAALIAVYRSMLGSAAPLGGTPASREGTPASREGTPAPLMEAATALKETAATLEET
jgi:transcriptional regulator with XRE-family HTH domain